MLLVVGDAQAPCICESINHTSCQVHIGRKSKNYYFKDYCLDYANGPIGSVLGRAKTQPGLYGLTQLHVGNVLG